MNGRADTDLIIVMTSSAIRRCPSNRKVFGQKIDLYLIYNNICHSNFQTTYHERSVLCRNMVSKNGTILVYVCCEVSV